MTGEARWRRRPEVSTAVMGDEAVLYDPASARVVHLNATAAAVWDLCDGTRSIADIVALLVDAYDVEPGRAIDDTESLVRALTTDGLLVDSERA